MHDAEAGVFKLNPFFIFEHIVQGLDNDRMKQLASIQIPLKHGRLYKGGNWMTTITFDTHEFIKELKSAGFSEEQAEIITKLQKAAVSSTLEQARHDYDLDNLVTNQSLDLRIKDVELKIAETKADLIRWVVSVGLLQTALIAGLLLKLISALP